jgi:hypothetical protein
MECLENGQLENHGRHLAIEGDPVENFDHAVVRQSCVGGVTSQEMAVTFDDVFVSKSIPRWHKEMNPIIFTFKKRKKKVRYILPANKLFKLKFFFTPSDCRHLLFFFLCSKNQKVD